MAYRKTGMNEAKIARLYKEGRGQGRRSDYLPWITTYDLASTGRAHRVFGMKAGRQHHFHSDGEWRTFLHLDWCEDVQDIREQFPLDRKFTRRIAESLRIHHPTDAESQTLYVMTTDFLVDIWRDGKLRLEACAVKRSSDLENDRTLAKLEIERRFWAEQEIPWRLVTERDFNPVVTKNLQWLRALSFKLQSEPWAGFHREQADAVCREVPLCPGLSLREFCQRMDRDLSIEVGSTLTLMRHLLMTRTLDADLTRPLNDRRLMADFTPHTPMAERKVG
jgi:hypothetical protein